MLANSGNEPSVESTTVLVSDGAALLGKTGVTGARRDATCATATEPFVGEHLRHRRACLLIRLDDVLDEGSGRRRVVIREATSNKNWVVCLLSVQLLGVLKVERVPIAQHGVKHDAHRPDVSFEGIVRLLGNQLWRVVRGLK